MWLMLDRPQPADASVLRLQVTPPPELQLTGRPTSSNFAISHDGRTLIYHAITGDSFQLFRRNLDSLDVAPIAGTDRAQSPSFSPDGSQIAFFSRGAIRTVPVTGGTPVIVCEIGGIIPFIAWSDSGEIWFTQFGQGPLKRVSATGGEPTTVVTLDTEKDGNFFVLQPSPAAAFSRPSCPVLSPTAVPASCQLHATVTSLLCSKMLVSGISRMDTCYSRNRMNCVRCRSIHDKWRSPARCEPLNALGRVRSRQRGMAPSSICKTVWKRRQKGSGWWCCRKAARSSEPSSTSCQSRDTFACLRMDGVQALTRGPLNFGEIWLYDVQGAAQPIKLALRGSNYPVWSPSSGNVVFQRAAPTGFGLLTVAADGSALEPTPLLAGDETIPEDWSKDGTRLLYQATTARTGTDLMLLDRASGNRQPWLQTQFNEAEARISPDGTWVTYVSDQTGRAEVWIRRLEGSTGAATPFGEWRA
jgi:Tol biopolymer transport system component